ncbi:hypothetical protein ACOSP7_004398 [Xanthoceras sorbifolium]
MADAIVSSVLEQLTSSIGQQIEQDVKLIWGASKEVKRLTNSFQSMQAVLVDAEQRQMMEKTVRIWLDRLKDVSYDVEDVLDEWNTSKLKLQIERHQNQNALVLKKKVCTFLFSPCFCFRQVVLHHDIALKIKEINENLDDIVKDKERYNFNTIGSYVQQYHRAESISFIDESKICSRDTETNTLVSKLLCESSDQKKGLHVISLVGMGGIGKTTLAQLAYNNNEVTNNFEIRIWVCVSEPFDKLMIAKAIIEKLEGRASDLATLQSTVERISESLKGKRFLLILDDVWTEDYKDWEPFHYCLNNGVHGSKILVTTRKQTTALLLGSIDIISIKELSEEQCWPLFRHLAFFGRPDKDCEELEQIGREIVSKCKGLPLAVKTMGSLLRFKKTRIEWENIMENKMWVLEEFEKGIFPPLLLSYNDLPPMVKRCFSYCAIFPKDHHLIKDELIRLWMAQGYLKFERNKEIEIVGEEYFNILAARSFFQDFVKDDLNNILGCKMHDMVHDVAQFLTKNECLATKVEDFGEANSNLLFEKVHHLMLKVDEETSYPMALSNFKNLRSLLIQFGSSSSTYSSDEFLLKLLDQNRCLRALEISGTTKLEMMRGGFVFDLISFEEVPIEIGKLMHLRYLNLSNNLSIIMLPETLCELYNLQVLNVGHCKNLRELPQGMGKLVNFRHLINNHTDSLSYMPRGMEKLTALRTLREFHVSGDGYGGKACPVECLNNFNHLRGCIYIRGLGNLKNASEARKFEIRNKKNILEMGFGFNGSDSMNNEAILEALQPHPNLKFLRIAEYSGNTVFPDWMVLLTNLRMIKLYECINCEHFPPLGKLSSLESIQIAKMHKVKRLGNEFLGIECENTSSSSLVIFPKLKHLVFYNMKEWEEWDFVIGREGEDDRVTIMPSLHSLEIDSCPKLKVLPKQLLQRAALTYLFIGGCPLLSERYRKGTGENWTDISHIPIIKIDGEYVQRDRR